MSVEVVLVVEGIHLDREESSKWSGVGEKMGRRVKRCGLKEEK